MKILIASLMACLAFNLMATDALGQQKNDANVTLRGQVVCSQCYYEPKPDKAPYGSTTSV